MAYSGKLQIGYGDQDNTVPTMVRSNNAIPICAGNPLLNPATTFPAGTTLGRLIVNGRANQVGSGAGATLTFQAVSATSGSPRKEISRTAPRRSPRSRTLACEV